MNEQEQKQYEGVLKQNKELQTELINLKIQYNKIIELIKSDTNAYKYYPSELIERIKNE